MCRIPNSTFNRIHTHLTVFLYNDYIRTEMNLQFLIRSNIAVLDT